MTSSMIYYITDTRKNEIYAKYYTLQYTNSCNNEA